MDGAIICDRDATRLLHAAVQLMPDASIDTNESGTRHRTAERTAIQTGFPGDFGERLNVRHFGVR